MPKNQTIEPQEPKIFYYFPEIDKSFAGSNQAEAEELKKQYVASLETTTSTVEPETNNTNQ
jgi:hypothetical protein